MSVADTDSPPGFGWVRLRTRSRPTQTAQPQRRYEPGAAPSDDTRAGRNDRRLLETEWRPETIQLARRVQEHAHARGVPASQFALAWVLNSRYITSTIAGPRTEAQWDDYLPALDFRLDADDEAFVDARVPTGHPSTPGFNDPGHPFFGRVPRTGGGQR